jgi:hypothetical protein
MYDKETTGNDRFMAQCTVNITDWINNGFDGKLELFDKRQKPIKFPEVLVHSANPIGSANIMGYINNFLMNEGQDQTCVRVKIPHR